MPAFVCSFSCDGAAPGLFHQFCSRDASITFQILQDLLLEYFLVISYFSLHNLGIPHYIGLFDYGMKKSLELKDKLDRPVLRTVYLFLFIIM